MSHRRRRSALLLPEHEDLLRSIDGSDPDRGEAYRDGLVALEQAGHRWAAGALRQWERWAWMQAFAKDRRRIEAYVNPSSSPDRSLTTYLGVSRQGATAQLPLLDLTREEHARSRDEVYAQADHLTLKGKLHEFCLGFLAAYPRCKTVRQALKAANLAEADFWTQAESAL